MLGVLVGCSVGCSGKSGLTGDGGSATGDMSTTVTGDSATFTMSSFSVASGQEVYYCQTFANPFGEDVEISSFESHMTTGSHHLLLLFQDSATDGTLTPCSGLTFGPMPYGSQRPDDQIVYPSGIAALVKASQGFNLVVHYLNATANDIPTTNVTVTLHKATPGTVTTHAGVFFLDNISALTPGLGPNGTGGIPPNTTMTINASYTTKQDMNIIYAVSHMHQKSLNLTATYGTTPTMLYTTDSWDSPPQQAYTPPVLLPAGTAINWSCTIDNDTSTTLTFGESAQTNEMCIFNGQYWPAPDDSPTINVMK
ncbi:MAG TPA: hypothetical protein VHB97_27550 [Polyangia bacterium]|nr:hypothetical protein [Polyangia bacterium]